MIYASHRPPVRATTFVSAALGATSIERVCVLAVGRARVIEGVAARSYARAAAPRSVDRGDEATGSAVENKPSVLPWRALTESSQSLRIAPDRTWVRLVSFRQCVRLGGLLLRQIESLHNRLEHRITCRTKLPRGSATPRLSELVRAATLDPLVIRLGRR
jgi:hypothetical protein